MRLILVILSVSLFIRTAAQSPVAAFSVKSTACISESLEVTNTSTNSTSYEWDFCLGDIRSYKSTAAVITVPGLGSGTDYKLVEAGGLWYAFLTSYDNQRIYRLNYGTSPLNVPTLTDLGTFGGLIFNPYSIDIIFSNGEWYGFVGSLSNYGVIKLKFGSSLATIPTASNMGDFGLGSNYIDVRAVNQSGDWMLVLSSPNIGSLVTINFTTSFDNAYTAGDVKTFTVTGAGTSLRGFDIVKAGGNWVVVMSNATNSIYVIRFGNDLKVSPTSVTAYPFSGVATAFNVQVVQEGSKYYGVVGNLSLQVALIDFLGFGISDIPAEVSHPTLPTLFGLQAIRSAGKTYVLGAGLSGQVSNIVFESNCGASITTFTGQDPPLINYSTSGSKEIGLVASASAQESSSVGYPVTVLSVTAPDISFSSVGICVSAPVVFTAANISGNITTYDWNLGDTNVSTQPSPSHTYSTTNTYNIVLKVTATNTCENLFRDQKTIYNPPVANFNLPTNNPLCTNQSFVFTNTSTFDVGTTPTWQWSVDGTPVSTVKDLNQSFASASAPSIKLAAILPGCNSENTKSLTSLLAGPVISFTIPTLTCQNALLEFTNATTDPVTSFLWNFGDGQTSSSVNGSHGYSTPGTYLVSLQGSSANGCENSLIKSVKIYSLPTPNFSLSLPPFSCNGSTSQLNDATPNPSDSFISSWLWDFNDPSSGQNTATSKNPQHIYSNAGPYNVSLTVGTNFGCSASVQKQVVIAQSPLANFTNTPVCKDQAVNFKDASGNQIQSWYWQIDAATYFFSNPTHIFTAPGNHLVELTVVGSNNCISYFSKTLIVPTPITPNFSVDKKCNLQNTLFTDLTVASTDPVAKRDWEFGAIGTGQGSPTSFSFPTPGSYDVKLKTTTLSGCSYTTTKPVNIINSPIASFNATPEQGVPPLNVKFNNTSSNATSYAWAFHDKNNTTSTLPSPSFIFEEYGDNVVDLTASNTEGCLNTTSKIIKTLLPVKDVAVTGLTVIKNEDGSYKVLAALKNNGNTEVSNFLITLDLSGFTAVREKVLIPIVANAVTNHVFTYEILDASRLDFLCAEIELEGDNNDENNKKCASLSQELVMFEPYPNPADDVVHIDIITNEPGLVWLSLIDAMGKETFVGRMQLAVGENNFKLNVEAISNGIYFLILDAGKLKRSRRVVISHK